MIAKRWITAKTPYAPYAVRLILSCVALDDKKTEGWRRNDVKISIYAGLSVFARLCSVFYGGWLPFGSASRRRKQHLRATSRATSRAHLPFLTFWGFWRFRSRFMLPKYMAGWRTAQLSRLNWVNGGIFRCRAENRHSLAFAASFHVKQ